MFTDHKHKNLIWDVLCLTSNREVTAWRPWARDCHYQRHTQYPLQINLTAWVYDPSVNRTAESYFTTKVNKRQKQSEIKLDGSLKYHGANCRYGAHVGGLKRNAINLILRLFLYHILHTMSSWCHESIRNSTNNQQTPSPWWWSRSPLQRRGFNESMPQ